MAARSLGRLGDGKIINALIDALSDSQWFVRYNAANSILDIDNSFFYIIDIFEGKDKFAKDMMLSTLENRDKIQIINSFKYSSVPERKKIYQLINNYKDEKNEARLL